MDVATVPKITPKAARVNAGLTQKDAAKALKISQATLQSYERGCTVPQWDVVEQMEFIYRYPASFIDFSQNSLKERKRKYT